MVRNEREETDSISEIEGQCCHVRQKAFQILEGASYFLQEIVAGQQHKESYTILS